MELHSIKKYKGHTVNLYYDPDASNPRTEYDNVGTMFCWHSRYSLGDEQPEQTSDGQLFDLACIMHPSLANWQGTDEALKATVEGILADEYIMLPLYLYDHSGITMSTRPFACPWDSGQVGFICCTKAQAIYEWGKKICTKKVREQAENHLRGEVRTYDAYLRGEVLGYDIEGPHCNDSCWEFYDDDFGRDAADQCLIEAKSSIDYAVDAARERTAKLKELIRNRVPLEARNTILAEY